MKRDTIVKRLPILAFFAVVGIAIATLQAFVPAAYASSACSDATLTGRYAFIQPAGFTSNSPGHPVPWQYVGTETFDGMGNTTVSYTAAVNGDIFTGQSSAGTYQVNSDCTGSLTFTSGDAEGFTADIVIVHGGSELFGIVTNHGDTASFDEKRQ